MNLLPFSHTLLKLLGLKIHENPFHRIETPDTMALAEGREEKGTEALQTVEGNSGVTCFLAPLPVLSCGVGE